jgi:hypothetical protein
MVAQRKVSQAREDSVLKRICLRVRPHGFLLFLVVGVMAGLLLPTTSSLRSEQNPAPAKNGSALVNSAVNEQAAPTPPKQKGEPKKSDIEKTQDDAAALSALADQLRDELNKMNANVLALDVIHKTEEVEKLARKIKGEAVKQ